MSLGNYDPEKIEKLLQWFRRHYLLGIICLLFIVVSLIGKEFLSGYFKKLGELSVTHNTAEIPKQYINEPKTLPKMEPAKKEPTFRDNIKQEVTGDGNIVAGRDITIPEQPQTASKPQGHETEDKLPKKPDPSSSPSGSIKQEVKGDRNIVAARDVNLIINYFYFFTGQIHFTEADTRTMKPKAVEKKVSELAMKVFHKSSDEAEEWADNFLGTLSTRKERLQTDTEDKRKKSERDMEMLPIVFGFILQSFDEKISTLGKRVSGINSSSETPAKLVAEHGSPDLKNSVIRKVTFPNMNSVEIVFTSGVMRRGIIQDYPELGFVGIMDNQRETLLRLYAPPSGTGYIRFGRPPIPDIAYSVQGDSILSDNFRKEFSKGLEEVIGMLV